MEKSSYKTGHVLFFPLLQETIVCGYTKYSMCSVERNEISEKSLHKRVLLLILIL